MNVQNEESGKLCKAFASAGGASRLYVGVRVEIRQQGPASARIDSLYITITPGQYITNLMAWPVYIQTSTTEACSESFQVQHCRLKCKYIFFCFLTISAKQKRR